MLLPNSVPSLEGVRGGAMLNTLSFSAPTFASFPRGESALVYSLWEIILEKELEGKAGFEAVQLRAAGDSSFLRFCHVDSSAPLHLHIE